MKRLLAASAAVLLLAAGCGGPDSASTTGRAGAVPVEIIAVAPGGATATVSATGTIKARDDVPISAEAGGRVEEVLVRVGDRVAAGEVLVRLDDELAALAARQAEGQLLLAEAELSDAEASLRRATSLWESADISDAEFEAAERREKVARATRMTAEAGLGRAERQLRNASISSPVSGIVAFVHAEVGHLVAVGTPVAQVVNDAYVEVEIGLNEDDVIGLSRGQTAQVAVRALPEEVFEGSVEYVGPRADDRTKTYPVRVVLANRGRRLRSGMVAKVTIASEELEDVIIISRDWVVERYGEPAVFVASDSLALMRKVSLGRVIGDRVVVRGGLAPGEQIVTLGHDQITDGSRIDIKSSP